ncbi:OCIA domain-containing protein 2 isoform X2 [Pan troglodytes]|uniref:OCIA domain-containing protein 2 isoform X2 n=1 Tax=Pan troglodytes TaxID=9598 RepID=UPI0030135804
MSGRKFLEESSAFFSCKHAYHPGTSLPRNYREAILCLSLCRSPVSPKASVYGYLAANSRFGSLPKVALAGLLGFGLGKVSYIGVCQSKFHFFEDQLRGAGFGPQHNRHCLLTCEECKIKHGLSEKGDSQASAS